MDINQLYSLWLENASADPDLKTELESIKGKEEEMAKEKGEGKEEEEKKRKRKKTEKIKR